MSFLIVLFAVLGGLVAYHMEGSGRIGRTVWRGVIIGAIVGLLLPIVFGVVGVLLHLIFGLAVVAIIVLGVLALIHFLR